MTRTVYQTDAAGLFVGEVQARESPLEPGVFMIPAGCVEEPPPAAEAKKAAVWMADAWTLVADHRGEVWFSGDEAVTVDFVGDPGERGYNATAPAVDPGPAALGPLTARQLRLGLLQIGIKPADVAAAISALPEDQRDVAEIEWDYASEYRRDHPLIAALGSSFGLSVDQIDDAWRDAMAL